MNDSDIEVELKGLMAEFDQLLEEFKRLEQKVCVLDATIRDNEGLIATWQGYTKRRISELTLAINRNTAGDDQLRSVVERLDKSEKVISKQETKHREIDRSNIVVYGALLMIAILVVHGKLESGDITELLLVILPGIAGVGTMVRYKE